MEIVLQVVISTHACSRWQRALPSVYDSSSHPLRERLLMELIMRDDKYNKLIETVGHFRLKNPRQKLATNFKPKRTRITYQNFYRCITWIRLRFPFPIVDIVRIFTNVGWDKRFLKCIKNNPLFALFPDILWYDVMKGCSAYCIRRASIPLAIPSCENPHAIRPVSYHGHFMLCFDLIQFHRFSIPTQYRWACHVFLL